MKLGLSQPWVNIGSDAETPAPEGAFLLSNPHPRAYGNFARFLGRYVRDQKVTTLQDAIRRLTRLPAETSNCKIAAASTRAASPTSSCSIRRRSTTTRRSTNRTSTRPACVHVFVNGVQVLRDGEHTGAKPGQVVRGPGWVGWKKK